MKKYFKYSLLVILGIITLIAVAIIVLLTVVDPNRFKPLIIKAAYQATGRQLIINSNIAWKIYPNLCITIKQASLSNPGNFGATNFLTLNSVDVSVELLPLLSKHIVVKSFLIDGLNLSLIKKNGINNWNFELPTANPEENKENMDEEESLHLAMSSFGVTHSNFTYNDMDLQHKYFVPNVNLMVTTGFGGGINFDQHSQNLDLAKVELNYNDLIVSKFNLTIKNFSNPEYKGNIEINKLKLNTLLDSLNIGVVERKSKPLFNNVTVRSKDFNGDKNNVAINDLLISLSDIVTAKSNSLKIKNLAQPNIMGDINLPKFNLNKVLDFLSISNDTRKDKPLLNNFTFNSKFNVTPTQLSFKDAKFNLNDLLSGTTNLQLYNFKALKYNGVINLPTFSLNLVMPQLGMAAPVINNQKLLDKVALNTKFAGTLYDLSLTQLYAKLANSTIVGNIAINSFKPLAFNENIQIDNIDIADFSDINGFRVLLNNLQLKGVGSGLALSSLTAKQNLQIDNVTVLGVNLDRLVLQLYSIINNAGSNNNDVIKIILNSSQVLQAINSMKTEVAKVIKPGVKDLNQKTNLGKFSGVCAISNGMLKPSAFKLNGPTAVLNGVGTVKLTKVTAINYMINATVLTNGINPIFKQLVFPVTVHDSIDNPKADLNWGSIQQQLIKYSFTTNKSQIQNIIKDQINNRIDPQHKNPNKAVDDVSKGITNALGTLLGQ